MSGAVTVGRCVDTAGFSHALCESRLVECEFPSAREHDQTKGPLARRRDHGQVFARLEWRSKSGVQETVCNLPKRAGPKSVAPGDHGRPYPTGRAARSSMGSRAALLLLAQSSGAVSDLASSSAAPSNSSWRRWAWWVDARRPSEPIALAPPRRPRAQPRAPRPAC